MATPKRKVTRVSHSDGVVRSARSGRFVAGATTARHPEGTVAKREGGRASATRLTQPQQRTAFLIEALGSATAVAELLEVSRSQPGKWRTGEESPSPAVSTLLVDLDHVMARASLLWPAEVAKRWLVGTEPFLGGARPIDALRLRGSREVIDALDAITSGAYA